MQKIDREHGIRDNQKLRPVTARLTGCGYLHLLQHNNGYLPQLRDGIHSSGQGEVIDRNKHSAMLESPSCWRLIILLSAVLFLLLEIRKKEIKFILKNKDLPGKIMSECFD